MKNLFNPDGKFFAIMEPVADMMILNLLFLTTSLPLITVGTSLTALYSVVMKQAEGTSSHVVKEYLYAWRSNFRQSCILWCLSIIVYALLTINLKISKASSIMHLTITFIFILSVMITMYIFPLIAKFDNTIRHTIVNALLLSVRHFFTTFILAGVSFFFLFITAFSSAFFKVLIVSWFLFLFALIARIQAFFLHRIFVRYTEPSS